MGGSAEQLTLLRWLLSMKQQGLACSGQLKGLPGPLLCVTAKTTYKVQQYAKVVRGML
jgi:hypothetical protein